MATTIHNIPSGTVPSCQIPEIRVTGDPPLRIGIARDDTTIFDESFNAGAVTLYELREIIESDMRSTGSAERTYSLATASPSGVASAGISVLFSREIPSGNLQSDLQSRFLTPALTRRIPSDASLTLWLYADEEPETPRFTVTFLHDDGSLGTAVPALSPGYAGNGSRLWRLSLSMAAILRAMPVPYTAITSVAVNVGERFAGFIIDPEMEARPPLELTFRNAHNLPDKIYLPAMVTRKVSHSFSEAQTGGRLTAYDHELTEEYEVKSASLTHREALLAAQLVESRDVYVGAIWPPQRGATAVPCLVSDAKCETGSYDTKPPAVSFTLRIATPARYVPSAASPGIFTEPFDPTYM